MDLLLLVSVTYKSFPCILQYFIVLFDHLNKVPEACSDHGGGLDLMIAFE